LFFHPSAGTWRANGNPNPCTGLDEIYHAYSYLAIKGLDAGLTPSPPPLGLGSLKL